MQAGFSGFCQRREGVQGLSIRSLGTDPGTFGAGAASNLP